MDALPNAVSMIEYQGAPEALSEWLRAKALSVEAWQGETPAVLTLRRVALELDAAFQRNAARPVSLVEAARIGGYSVSHLGRLLRQQPERNVGTKRRPAFACDDVPRKAGYHPSRNDAEDAAAPPSPSIPTDSSPPDHTPREDAGAIGARFLSTKADAARRRRT